MTDQTSFAENNHSNGTSVPDFLANELETIRAKIHAGGFKGNPTRQEKNFAAALVAKCIVEIRFEGTK